jgi:hypothetical protein
MSLRGTKAWGCDLIPWAIFRGARKTELTALVSEDAEEACGVWGRAGQTLEIERHQL